MFSAYVTAHGQAWADFDVYMPDRWARDLPRRRAAGIPDDLEFATKPQLAMRQLDRLTAAGLSARWVAFDEVYGRSEKLRKKAAKGGLAYVAIIPCDYQVTLPSGTAICADQAVKDAVFERRSCGNGFKGPRYSDWAMTATAAAGQSLLIRRLISRPDQLTFYLCWTPPGRPATMTSFITIAGRRGPGRGNVQDRKGRARLGPDPGPHLGRDLPAHRPGRSPSSGPPPSAAHSPPASPCPPPPAALVTTAARRAAMTRSAMPTCRSRSATPPSRPAAGQPCPPGIAPIRLSIAETARLASLAAHYTAGLITRARLAFTLRWSLLRRRHQATARWHHYSARLLAVTGTR